MDVVTVALSLGKRTRGVRRHTMANHLLLERIKYLGMTVVGESDGGIIVGSIMKGYVQSSRACNPFDHSRFHSRGAVDADGRIQPGDMILQMNDISFEHISNSDAVRLLRETVKDAK